MASRTFEDSAGILWEVFEVRRTSEAPRGVSEGLERGWLTFVSAGGKRRLAPFPNEWLMVPEAELQRLCTAARVANPPRFSEKRPRTKGENRPRLQRSRTVEPELGAPMLPPGASQSPDAKSEGSESLVRDVVRMFAQEARRDKLPAIAAMVRLKALLAERYGGAEVEASTRADLADVRRIRRWFVEAYYFERPA